MDIPASLIYNCASEWFRRVMNELTVNRIMKLHKDVYPKKLEYMYFMDQYCILKFQSEKWALLEAQSDQCLPKIRLSPLTTWEFVFGYDADKVYRLLGESHLLHPAINHTFMKELIQARQAALEHLEREQLKRLQEKYPDEVSQ